jgi:hypothetical protein
MGVEVIEGRKNSTLWVCGEYAYVKDQRRGQRQYLKCREMRTCGGRAVLDLDTMGYEMTKEHVCRPTN